MQVHGPRHCPREGRTRVLTSSLTLWRFTNGSYKVTNLTGTTVHRILDEQHYT